jgi:hypothetical protein
VAQRVPVLRLFYEPGFERLPKTVSLVMRTTAGPDADDASSTLRMVAQA